VCAPTGEPLALFDPQGHRVWRQPQQSLYGMQLKAAGENAELNPEMQFAGQWLDAESGLVYNRFRYFSPEASVYLTPDPLGLLGGTNPYSYVHNPTGWIDPLGLVGCSTKLGKNMMENMGLSRSAKWSGYQAHHVIPKELANHPALKKINYDIDVAANGIFLRKADNGVSAMARHQGNHHGYTDAVRNALDRIDLKQSKEAISKQVANIQDIAKKGMMDGNIIRSKDMYNTKIFGKDVNQIGRQRVFERWSKILG
ncbi:AHH domain-containing protein, partial [Xenorhabdus nematophila]